MARKVECHLASKIVSALVFRPSEQILMTNQKFPIKASKLLQLKFIIKNWSFLKNVSFSLSRRTIWKNSAVLLVLFCYSLSPNVSTSEHPAYWTICGQRFCCNLRTFSSVKVYNLHMRTIRMANKISRSLIAL